MPLSTSSETRQPFVYCGAPRIHFVPLVLCDADSDHLQCDGEDPCQSCKDAGLECAFDHSRRESKTCAPKLSDCGASASVTKRCSTPCLARTMPTLTTRWHSAS